MSTQLSKAISNSDTTLMIYSDVDFPDSAVIQIGTEKITYAERYKNTLYGCIRGAQSTTPAAHLINSFVLLVDYYYTPSVPATPVTSIHADSETNLTGDVQLVSGSSILLTQVGQSITIDSTAGSDGWEFSGTDSQLASATTNAIIGDNKKLILGNSNKAWMKYDSLVTGALLYQSDGGSSHLRATGTVVFSADNYASPLPLADSPFIQLSGAVNQIQIASRAPGVLNQLFLDFPQGYVDDSFYASITLFNTCDIGYVGDGDPEGIWNGRKHTRLQSVTGGDLQLNGLFGTSLQNESLRVDDSTAGGETRMLLWDVDAGALVRVTVGVDDSAGAGYKVLRIPN
jgi:hypothetical protein